MANTGIRVDYVGNDSRFFGMSGSLVAAEDGLALVKFDKLSSITKVMETSVVINF